MNNQVARINADAVAELEEPLPSMDEAGLAAIGADIPDWDATRVRDRAVIGRYVGGQVAGYVAGTGEWHQGMLEKAAKTMEAIMANEKASSEVRVKAAEAIKNLAATSALWAATQLKAAEMMGLAKRRRDRQSSAPQSITGINIRATSVQVNGK